MDYDFNSENVLPPVNTPLLIKVNDVAVLVERTSFIANKSDDMVYVTPEGRKYYGRFPWTYP